MPDYDVLVMSALGCAMIVSAVAAIVQTNLIRAVIAYAISSICLAGIFFLLASPYAGALELIVGAGLVAVPLFGSARPCRRGRKRGAVMSTRDILAVLFIAAFLILFYLALAPVPVVWPQTPPIITLSAGATLWKDRTFEVVLQGFIILTGVMAILLLVFGRRTGGVRMTDTASLAILVLAGTLFALGLASLIAKSHLIKMIMGLEFCGKGVSLLFLLGGYISGSSNISQAVVFSLIVIEAVIAGVALALSILLKKVYGTLDFRAVFLTLTEGGHDGS